MNSYWKCAVVVAAVLLSSVGAWGQRMSRSDVDFVLDEKCGLMGEYGQRAEESQTYFEQLRRRASSADAREVIDARESRVLSIIGFEIASIAIDIAEFLRDHKYDGAYSAAEMEELIGRFDTERNRFLELAGERYNLYKPKLSRISQAVRDEDVQKCVFNFSYDGLPISNMSFKGRTYKGTIGKYPMVMTLSNTAAHGDGYYYYESQGPGKKLALTLASDMMDGWWHASEYVNGKWNGRFYLKWDLSSLSALSTITGTYVNVNGQRFPVKLRLMR